MDDQLHLLTGAYALNALDEDERRHFESSLTPDSALTQEARELSQVAAMLAAGTTPVAPPADLKARLMAQIAVTEQFEAGTESQAGPPAGALSPAQITTPEPPLREGAPTAAPTAGADTAETNVIAFPSRRASLPTRWLAAVATVLAVATVGTAAWGFQAQSQRDEAQRLLDASQNYPAEAMNKIIAAPDAKVKQFSVPGGATMLVMHSEKEARGGVMTIGMSAAPEGKSYALWLIDQAGTAKPAGLVTGGSGTSTWNELPAGFGSASFLGLTIEPEGGSEQPTTKPIMVESIS